MSCCGKKRSQWMKESANESHLAHSSPPKISLKKPFSPPSIDMESEKMELVPKNLVVSQNPQLFQYQGHSSLTVKGAFTKQVYHFAAPNAQVEVAFEDAFALLAERDLRVI